MDILNGGLRVGLARLADVHGDRGLVVEELLTAIELNAVGKEDVALGEAGDHHRLDADRMRGDADRGVLDVAEQRRPRALIGECLQDFLRGGHVQDVAAASCVGREAVVRILALGHSPSARAGDGEPRSGRCLVGGHGAAVPRLIRRRVGVQPGHDAARVDPRIFIRLQDELRPHVLDDPAQGRDDLLGEMLVVVGDVGQADDVVVQAVLLGGRLGRLLGA